MSVSIATGVSSLDVLSSTGAAAVVGAAGTPVMFSGPVANSVFSSYGVTAYDTSKNGITIGLISATQTLSNDYPRFQTYNRKVVLSSTASEIRFNSATFTADPTNKAFSIDVYIPFMPSEFLGGSNPYIDISVHNSTTFGANYTRRSYNAAYLRQGWNTLKIRSDDTVSVTSGVGNLPTGMSRAADVGTGFDWTGTGQCFVLVFNNMNGQTVYVDEIRRPAKATPVVTIGFDASGFNAVDETFPNKVAPLFAQYGIKSYCTMTNVYELIYSGSQAWRRISNLYNNYGWDVINHTWSLGVAPCTDSL